MAATTREYKDGEINFLEDLYKGNYGKIDTKTYYGQWLCKLFFEALNMPGRKNEAFTLPDKSIRCIPYLNGGLFEESQEPEGHRGITFPDYMFEELFKFLNGYNFTIYENSPQDHTIAVDPGMLRYIFKNLLEDNKDTFYTPKDIVQYMTQESLIQ